MRKLRGSLNWGLCPQTPGIYRFFLARMAVLGSGDRPQDLSPAFPAAEPVARVASLRCPIPSGSGRLIINDVVRAVHEKPANGDNPLNFVSHPRGSPQTGAPPPRDDADVRQEVARHHMAWAAYAILHHNLVNHEDRREPYERVY